MDDNRGSGCGMVAAALGVILLLAIVGCCAGGVLLTWLAPSMMVAAVVDGEPLPVSSPAADPSASEAARQRVCEALLLGQPASLSGEELGRFVNEIGMAELSVFNVGFEGDRGELDVSFRPDPTDAKFFNLHLAGTFTMERGWVTVATIDELEASGWELGSYLAGEDLVDDFNRSLANERAESPEAFAALESFDTIAIRDGGLHLVPLAPGVTIPICPDALPTEIVPTVP